MLLCCPAAPVPFKGFVHGLQPGVHDAHLCHIFWWSLVLAQQKGQDAWRVLHVHACTHVATCGELWCGLGTLGVFVQQVAPQPIGRMSTVADTGAALHTN